MKWEVRFTSGRDELSVYMIIGNGEFYTDEISLPNIVEHHEKIFNFVKGNRYPIEPRYRWISFAISSNMINLEFKYSDYIKSGDKETVKLGISLFIAEILEKI